MKSNVISNGRPLSGLDNYEDGEKENTHWCTIYYNEYNKRLGDAFKGCAPVLHVDGWTCPTDKNRFCLGVIRNVSPHPVVELIKRRICNGIDVIEINGRISIKNITDFSIFIQSKYVNEVMHVEDACVQKIESGYEVDIFDLSYFQTKLENTLDSGYENVYHLKNFCTIYLSFIKGWGPFYKRQDLPSLPLWLEFKLIQPLKLLDKTLREMTSPDIKIELL